jgi:hypothetical protein
MKNPIVGVIALAAGVGTLLLGPASPAMAESTININPGNVPATAARFAQDCTPNLGGGPLPDQDVSLFNLPGDPRTTGVFTSLTAAFDTPDGPRTVTIPTDGGGIVNDMGTSRAWLRSPAGWTLTGATAQISGTAEFFVLNATCAASDPTPTRANLPVTGASGILVPMTVAGIGSVALGIVLVARYRRRDAED